MSKRLFSLCAASFIFVFYEAPFSGARIDEGSVARPRKIHRNRGALGATVAAERPAGRPISADGIFGTLSKRGTHTPPLIRKRPISILPVILN